MKIILVIEGEHKGMFITEYAREQLLVEFFEKLKDGDKLVVQYR